MDVIKCGLSSQTLAFAKSSDKVEKKPGVRLSKKDRRVMVESFIKTYQNSNNGNFPSVHITHKEVGGSYYIVREIVRDIIQENKVLGPPKVPQNESKTVDSLPGEYPLGSITMEPPISSVSLPNSVQELDDRALNIDVTLDTEKLADQSIDDSIYIGQKAPDGKLEVLFHEEPEATESLFEGHQDSENSKLEETVEQTEPSVGMISELSKAVVVETFPLQTSVKLSESQDTTSEDAVYINSVTSESVDDQPDVDPISRIVSVGDQKAGTSKIGETTNKHMLNKTSEDSLGTLNYASSKEGIEADVKCCDGQKGIISGRTTGVVEEFQDFAVSKPADIASNTTVAENLNGRRTDSIKKSNEKEAMKAKHETFQPKGDVKNNDIPKSSEIEAAESNSEALNSSTRHHTESKPTLDRINLESWEGTSRKPARQDSPFSSFVKACVTAFSKLWSK